MKAIASLSTSAIVAVLILSSTCVVLSEAFTVPPTTTLSSSTIVIMNLVPEQGKQLEAAMNAAYARAALEIEQKKGEPRPRDSDDDHHHHGRLATATVVSKKRLASARSFVARVFSLPSSIIRGHPHPKLEGLPENVWEDDEKDDIVLFPLVGFQFVPDAPNHFGVLPTAHASNPSCRLRSSAKEEEELVGWFSRACYLGELYGDNYCQDPAKTRYQRNGETTAEP